MLGGGKYEAEVDEVWKKVQSLGLILIVIDGVKGHGFECKATVDVTLKLPGVLRQVADEIERMHKSGLV